MTKLTKEQFISDAVIKHNNKYDYSKVTFNTRDDKITIVCPVHGEFEQTVKGHRRGAGCSLCANAGKVIGIDKFIKNAMLVHNSKYSYNHTVYVKAKEEVKITCKIHGSFWQSPNSHLGGHGCPDCGKIKCVDSKKYTQKDFITKSNTVHNSKYDYSKVKYTYSTDEVIIICPQHGEFMQSPVGHMQGKGCNLCGNISIGKKLSSNTDRWKNQAVKIHADRYTYDKVDYITSKQKVIITCPIHGDFKQSPY